MSSFNVEDYYTYRSDHKTYSVSFINEEQMKIFDIKNIFKEFGEINVVQTKSPTGYCFVNFFSVKDAKKCVKGMKNHSSKIKLVRPKQRDPLPNSSEKNDQDNEAIDTNNMTKSSGISERLKIKPLSTEDVSKIVIKSPSNLTKIKSSSKEPTTLKEAIESMNVQFPNYQVMLSKEKKTEITIDESLVVENKNEKPSSSKIFEGEKKEEEEKEKIVTIIEGRKKVKEMANEGEGQGGGSKLKYDTRSTRSTSSGSQSNSTEKIVTPINGSVCSTPDGNIKFPSMSADEIFHANQSLLKRQEYLQLGGKPGQVIEAQEVVVADIPDEFGTLDILYFFKQFQPILISEIKKTASLSSSVRYCHVYFSNIQEAENAEIYFDGMEIGKQKIIVLQPESLAQQAMIV